MNRARRPITGWRRARHSRAWHTTIRPFQPGMYGPVGLARALSLACRTPDLRAFTAVRSFGGSGSDPCTAPQRRDHRFIGGVCFASSMVERSWPARRDLAGQWFVRLPQQDPASHLSSALVPFSIFRSRARFVQGGQPCHTSRFSVASLLRFWRHSCSPAAELVRACDRGSGTDHASPASFSVAFRYRFRVAWTWSMPSRASVKEADAPTTLLGFSRPFAALFLRLRGAFGRPEGSNPACRFMNVRPSVFVRGIDRQMLYSLSGQSIKGRSFRLPGLTSSLSQAQTDD